jgi:gliotoxin/aspirochlorine biosynthesis peptide synthetase
MGSFQIKSEDGNAVVHDVVLDEICNALSISNHDINLNSSFIHLGGHSLSAILVASACRSRNVRISVESILRGKSLSEILSCSEPISNPSKGHRPPLGAISPNMAHKPDKMLKRATKIGRPQRAESCQPSTVSEAVCSTYSTTTSFRTPMTEMQMSLIHGNRNHPGTNIISFFETYRSQDVPTMRQAWKTVINSEEIFRTSFDLSDGRADLVSEVPIPFLWEEVVVDTHDAYETELEEDQYASRIGTHFKVVTWQISAHGPAISTIIWRTHHALVDGFSATLLYVKLRDVLKGLPIKAGTPFTEVATGLNTLQQASRTSSKKFWEKSCLQNSGASSKLLLPQPKSESSLTNETKTLTLKAPMDLLSAHARQLGVSLATLYHAAWALILSIYTDSNTVTFGVVLSGRNLPLPGVEDTVGPLINTLPLHLLLDEQLAVADFIGHVFHRLIDLGSVQFSRPQDGFSRDFSSALAAEFEMVPSNLDTPQPISRSYFTTVTDIPLSILIGSDGTLRICYHSNEYGDLDIELLVEHYHRALLMILSPDATIEICKDGILGPKSRDLIWEFGNCSSYETTAASICDDLVTLFELAAVDNPSAVAVEKGPVTLTYGDLNRMSDNLSTLLSHLIKPGDVVCVNADRSILWIIAIYGILKAGGVYSPLDPSLPNALRDSNFQISGAKIFLVSQLADRSLKPPSCENCLAIEELLAGSQPDTALLRNSSMRSSPTPSANAYMCFTSGSTGKPKGVMCSHEGLVAFQKALEVRLFAQPGCRISQIMSPAFDGSIHEIFSALSYGATLVLANSTDPFSHLALVDSAILTPSTAKLLDPEDYPKLRNVRCLSFT